MSPPFRWQAGKVWQGTGSAVRLPPRSWWILASRPSAPWLLTGIPDATGPLSSCSTLPGPSVLSVQARAPSSTSAGITEKAQCLQAGGALPFPSRHIQCGVSGPFCKSPQEWGRLCLSPPAHTHTHQTRPCHLPFYPLLSSLGLRIIYMCSVQKALPLASGVFSTPALVFKPLPVQTGSEMNTLENRGAASQWGESQILIPERGWEG